MNSDLSDVVLDFAAPYTVTRRARSTYTAGRLDAPSTSALSIQAVVVPVPARELQYLPQGLQSKDTRYLFTPTQLFTTSAAQGADLVSVGGESFEVQVIEPWDTLGSFFRAVISRIDP